MLDNLIKIFDTIKEFEGESSVCEGVSSKDNCIGISCHDCPFYSTLNLTATIDELKKAQEKQDV